MLSKLLHPIAEVGESIGVSRSMVYKLADAGELRIVHIGRRALITDESLQAYVERLTAQASGAAA